MSAEEHLGQQFHKPIKDYFASDKAYKVLDENPDTTGCTWTSGGCGVAAIGLHRALPGSEIHELHSSLYPNEAQHFVVKHQDRYLDAEGVSTRSRLRDRWLPEIVGHDLKIRPASESRVIESGVPSGYNAHTKTDSAETVAKHLRKALKNG